MPWYRNGHSVPVVYKGRESGIWWVDAWWDGEQKPFYTWREAVDWALTTIHPRPTDQWVTAPDGEEFLAGACQGHSACPVDRHEHGCFADDGTNCDHPEDHESTEQEQKP